jgi:DNA-binding GntR family transcriptional regulator
MAAAQSAREIAYDKLRSRIINMELRPGDTLNDRLLAEEMGISRTPVREAILMLNLAHMVDIKPQSGTHVAPIDLKLMEMEQYARFTLEKEMLIRAQTHITAKDLAAYRANIEEYRRRLAEPAGERREAALLQLDNAFHRMAFEINSMEAHFDHMLSTFQHIERLRMFSLMIGESRAYVCSDHTAIVQAVVDRDSAALGRALSTHLQRYKMAVEEARKLHPEYFVER